MEVWNIAGIPSLQKCSLCGGVPVVCLVSKEVIVNDLPVEKLWASCKKCAIKTGLKVPKLPVNVPVLTPKKCLI
jgi:hypothetical protein